MRIPPLPAATAAAAILLVLAVVLAGCTGTPAKASYSVDSKGVLSVTCVPATVSETVLFTNATYTKSRIVMHTQDGDVVAYLSAPPVPKAAFVYVPGAGETAAAHDPRMVRYAAAGYAFLFVDTRGRGGETPGLPFGPDLFRQDYAKFQTGSWPQYYLGICDLVNARQLLSDRYPGVPVTALGSSNGGRYAAIAAGVDPKFAGYIGVSTSDWGVLDSLYQQGASGDVIRFAASLEPSTYLKSISPRPVWLLHNATDPIIPFSNGQALFAYATDPKTFTGFSGSHGINSDVDDRILGRWAQIYGTRG